MLLLVSALACKGSKDEADLPKLPEPQRAFWATLQSLCGKAFAGTARESVPPDANFGRSTLRMHVRECSAEAIRVPFHVGDDRSRTWVITRTANGLRLKHDHRHKDGTEDSVTQYGGDTQGQGTESRQEFVADEYTANLIPVARTNIWTLEFMPGGRMAYALRRTGSERRFRVEFDLTQPIDAPPPPWGAK